MKKILALSLIGMAVLTQAAKKQDKVKGLPEVPYLTSDWYSGYLDVSATGKMHYVFVESQNDPETDPLVVWFEGGPGGSSMFGLFNGHGPFIIDLYQFFIKKNPESWT